MLSQKSSVISHCQALHCLLRLFPALPLLSIYTLCETAFFCKCLSFGFYSSILLWILCYILPFLSQFNSLILLQYILKDRYFPPLLSINVILSIGLKCHLAGRWGELNKSICLSFTFTQPTWNNTYLNLNYLPPKIQASSSIPLLLTNTIIQDGDI